MAGGKLSPRQKMINLMYLVFIAMLAMQMDKKVLSSFGFMKTKIEDTNVAVQGNISRVLGSLDLKASEQPEKFGDENKKAKQISSASNEFFNFLESVKDSILVDVDQEDRTEYESMSGGDVLDALFFQGDGFTPMGKKFEESIINYKNELISVLGKDINPGVKTNILKRFDTSDIQGEEGEGPQKWLKERYEGMPMITSLANITQIQGDVRITEAEIYNGFLQGQMTEDASLTNYKGIVALDKTAYFAGEKVTGKVVLGRYDATLNPDKAVLNGRDVTSKVTDGQVIVDIPAGNVGTNDIKGEITFTQDGELIKVPFESSYSVISEPDEAVISADKMNVVYRGLDNPISISLPGVGDKDVNATAPGLKKIGNGKYVMSPGAGNEVKINVSAKLSSGKPVNSVKTFRIKDIPAAAGTVRGDFGVVPMPKSSLNNTPINVELPDFVFELEFIVQSFNVKVPGQAAVKVNGSKFDARAKKVLAKSRRGDVITIFDIKAIEKRKGTPLKKVLPVSIQITN